MKKAPPVGGTCGAVRGSCRNGGRVHRKCVAFRRADVGAFAVSAGRRCEHCDGRSPFHQNGLDCLRSFLYLRRNQSRILLEAVLRAD